MELLLLFADDDAPTVNDVVLDAELAIASSCSISAVIDSGDSCELPTTPMLLPPRCCLIGTVDVWCVTIRSIGSNGVDMLGFESNARVSNFGLVLKRIADSGNRS